MDFIKVSEINNIATLTLNRPDKRNAMHSPLITECLQALSEFAADSSRVLVINGSGDNFCAGGDIAWMQKIANGSRDENYNDAHLLADLLYQLYIFPKPVIVLAHGATLGGGMGLVCAADIAIAANNAVFGLPEVKIGLAPSMISPYVISAIGERMAHYYFLTGERFHADVARNMGLVHQVVSTEALLSTGMTIAEMILENSPLAVRSAKELIRTAAKQTITEELTQITAEHLAELRASKEAQEGLRAFLEKRKPKWD
jgi:methylglutaconyl-CoA hydratase